MTMRMVWGMIGFAFSLMVGACGGSSDRTLGGTEVICLCTCPDGQGGDVLACADSQDEAEVACRAACRGLGSCGVIQASVQNGVPCSLESSARTRVPASSGEGDTDTYELLPGLSQAVIRSGGRKTVVRPSGTIVIATPRTRSCGDGGAVIESMSLRIPDSKISGQRVSDVLVVVADPVSLERSRKGALEVVNPDSRVVVTGTVDGLLTTGQFILPKEGTKARLDESSGVFAVDTQLSNGEDFVRLKLFAKSRSSGRR